MFSSIKSVPATIYRASDLQKIQNERYLSLPTLFSRALYNVVDPIITQFEKTLDRCLNFPYLKGGEYLEINKTDKIYRVASQVLSLLIIFPVQAVLAGLALPFFMLANHFKDPINFTSEVTAPPPSSDKVDPMATHTIATWNICGMNLPGSSANRLRLPSERVQEIIQDIKERPSPPILIGLQEVFSINVTRELTEALKGKYYVISDVLPSAFKINSGLVLASRYPIKAVCVGKYPDSAGDDRLSNKGFLIACIEYSPGKHLLIANTHLQAGNTKKREKAKAKQVDILLDAIDTFHKELGKDQVFIGGILALGDFNFSKGSPLDEKMRERFFEPSNAPDSTLYAVEEHPNPKKTAWGQTHWKRTTEKGEQLDHVYSSTSLDTTFASSLTQPADYDKPSGSSDHIKLEVKAKLPTFEAHDISSPPGIATGSGG